MTQVKSAKRQFLEKWCNPDCDALEKELLEAIEKDSQPSPEDKPASDLLKEDEKKWIETGEIDFTAKSRPKEPEDKPEERTKEIILRSLGISTQVKSETWKLINLAMEKYASQEVRKALKEQTKLRWSDEDMKMAFNGGYANVYSPDFDKWLSEYKSKTGNNQ